MFLTIFGSFFEPMHRFQWKHFLLQMVEPGNYDENAEVFREHGQYQCSVSIGPELATLEESCTIRMPKGLMQPVDIRHILAHKISTLLWINSMPKVRQKGLVCLGYSDKERVTVEVQLQSGKKVSSKKMDVSVSISGEKQLSLLLLQQPGCLQTVGPVYCIAVPDWGRPENRLRIVQLIQNKRRAVMQFDMDVVPGRTPPFSVCTASRMGLGVKGLKVRDPKTLFRLEIVNSKSFVLVSQRGQNFFGRTRFNFFLSLAGEGCRPGAWKTFRAAEAKKCNE